MHKKYLGQHFLQNKGKLLKVVNIIDRNISCVIEIGPGHGELTQHLLQAGFRVVCIEKDADMVSFLEKKFNPEITSGALKIVLGDALEQIPNNKFQITNRIQEKSYAIVGNIPYYITGHLLRKIGELKYKPTQTIFLIQEEVAERLSAGLGKMNLLAASVGWWADARVVTRVPRAMFSPPPKVDSAVVELKTKNQKQNIKSEDAYFTCIHAVFKQPRRTIVKNLVDAGVGRVQVEQALVNIGLSITARPQELTIENLTTLSKILNAS